MYGSIIVTLTYDQDHAYFRVKDTGVGIPVSGLFLFPDLHRSKF